MNDCLVNPECMFMMMFLFVALVGGCANLSPWDDGQQASAQGQRNDPVSSNSTLRVVDGRPSIVVDGQRLTSIYSETHPAEKHKHNVQMAGAGVNVFLPIVRGGHNGDFHATYFWRGDGVYGDESDRNDGLSIERQVQEILEVKPDAYFIVRWGSAVPKAWAEAHPDHLQASEEEVLRRASYASRLAARGRAEQARRIVEYCEGQPWSDRVVGYIPFGQDEGTHILSLRHSMFDQAPVMQERFREFLRDKYETDGRLRDAWNDPDATIDTASVPTDLEWEEEVRGGMHWPEPQTTQRYQDYFLLLRQLQMYQRRTELAAVKEAADRPILAATDAYKEPMLGWLHNDAFDAANRGMEWRNVLLASGCFDAGEALDMPVMDALATPADYTARSVGFGWDSEGANDSMVLRGKTIFVEDDARSFAVGKNTQGAWRNTRECRAGLKRNLAIAASRGHIPYWMNVGGGFFDDQQVLDIVSEQIPLRRELLTRPLERTEHAVAMIVDDTSPLYEDFTSGFQNLAVLRQRNDHLHNTGLPWRTYLFSDLERDNFPDYRVYLLPNLFKLTPERAKLIREKLMRDGNVLIFGPGTGITDGREYNVEFTSEFLGIPLKLVRREVARRVLAYGGDHAALADMRGPLTYGDSFSYGPLIEPDVDPDDADVVELGRGSTWWESNEAGLVMREFGKGARGNGRPGERGEGDYAVVFSVATPVPSQVLRSLALYAGCNPWSEIGDVVAANGNMVAVHTIRNGKRTIRLPEEQTVIDAKTSKVVGEEIDHFEVEFNAPQTRVFLLE